METFLNQPLFNIGKEGLTVGNLLGAILVLFLGWFISYLFKAAFHRYAKRRKIDTGREYAVTILFKYFIVTIAVFLAIQALGISMNVIWAGGAALFVGLGFGVQQIFNDLVSGIILLIEGTVEIGDVVIVDGIVGVVVSIGLRTSQVETRDRVVIIIPNSKLVSDNVVNWSHNRTFTRFDVNVGVAYASDVRKVEQILLEVAANHPVVQKDPPPRVAFKDYGDSALVFSLFYFSEEFLSNEFVKSDLRFEIHRAFRENNIEIPFPQRDLWIRNPEMLKGNE